MSYVRFDETGERHAGVRSEVYVFDDIEWGGTTCCACRMKLPGSGRLPGDRRPETRANYNCRTHQEMIDHLRAHQIMGHAVPEVAIERLATSPDFRIVERGR